MAPSQSAKASKAPQKKEKIFHPSSRKAAQLARTALRKGKLGNLASKRGQKNNSLVDFYGFFYHALPEEGVLTLPELHHIVGDIWLTRFDEELEQERAARRIGRPKSAREMKLEEIKLREAEEYRTGMEVPDLTHPATVEVFRRWDQKELAYIQLLRFIRITSVELEVVVVSRPGKHASVVGNSASSEKQEDQGMGDAEGA
ncbi:putative translation machinery-associated protein 16 [Lyophyllum shimeji]|uniref:Translation machinery-associated protein 16 n=1 Tax=Lyophyllum shimeji TaxID=47721 RepID=A0A9P3PUF3_LYOSH|nr:putative translation machinery-associated protein 16 [Lyophyllum shimeji]